MLSSQQVAKKLGITGASLSRYLSAGKIPRPKTATSGGITIYMWTEEEIEHVRQLLPKIANGRKTRYKKKQSATGSQQSRQARDRSAKAKGKTKSKKKKT
jgi:predicted transcriptional regulator